MRIDRVETIPYRIPYRKALKFASGMVTEAEHVLIRITTSDGVIGIADAPPRPYTYGETQASIVAVIEQVFAPQLIGARLSETERIHEMLDRTVANNVAKGAVDIAIWDALGRTLGLSVNELLGGYGTGMRVSHMLGFDSPEAVLDEALAMRETYGIDAFKVKVGRLPVRDDLAVCSVLRDGLGAETELYVDANRGWTADQALAALPSLIGAGVSMLEEPNDAKQSLGRRRLVQHSPIPIVGDESVPTPGDAARELLSGGCTAVSIKTARGGFTNAARVLDLCDGLGVEVLMGNQIDGQLGTAATVAFGAARKSTSRRPGELSNYLGMVDDVVAQPLVIAHGYLTVPSGPGVGVDIDESKLSRYRLDRG